MLLSSRAAGPCPTLAADPGRGGMRGVASVGWGGGEVAVGAAGQLPAALVDRPVVGPADQGQVGQVGGAAVQPVQEMMAFAPGQGPVTVGEPTAAVPGRPGRCVG